MFAMQTHCVHSSASQQCREAVTQQVCNANMFCSKFKVYEKKIHNKKCSQKNLNEIRAFNNVIVQVVKGKQNI